MLFWKTVNIKVFKVVSNWWGIINIVCLNISACIGQQDQLFYLIYERVHIKGNYIPHMWGYRPTITPEHIILKLQERDAKKEHPVLWEFLQAVYINYFLSLYDNSATNCFVDCRSQYFEPHSTYQILFVYSNTCATHSLVTKTEAEQRAQLSVSMLGGSTMVNIEAVLLFTLGTLN